MIIMKCSYYIIARNVTCVVAVKNSLKIYTYIFGV